MKLWFLSEVEVSGIPSVAVKCVDIRRNTSGEGGAWLQANLDYVIPAGMKKDDIKIEAAKRNVLFIQW